MKSKVSLLFLAAAVGLPSTVYGDIINVTPGNLIQQVIDNANDGDEIVFAPGTYVMNVQIEGKDLILRSSDGAETTILRPQQLSAPILVVRA